jgi:TrmH family RNA methyltransferase
MILTSSHNPLLRKVRRAVEDGRATDSGALVAEGPHLVGEALRSNWTVEHVLFSDEHKDRHHRLLRDASAKGIETIEIGARAFRVLSETAHGQGILSLVRPREHTWESMFASTRPVVVLDGIQDPGNAGAIVRSAEAFGAGGVIFTSGGVRVANGKLLRATAGSMFRVPFRENEARGTVIQRCLSAKRTLIALKANAERTLLAHKLAASILIVGSEGGGISDELLAVSEALSVPTEGVESLNAAVACSIVLFEAARQRGARE